MPLVLGDPLLRSIVFRISLLNSALLALAMVGAGIGGWISTRGEVQRHARDRIALETRAMAIELAEEGLSRTADAIRSRSERPGALEYLLVGPRGQVIAGDMMVVPRTSGWHRLSLPDMAAGLEGKEELLALTTILPDRTLIAVGEDLGRAEAARQAVLRAIVTAGAIALVIGLALGFIITRRTLRRMQLMVATVRAVEGGDLTARVPELSKARDDVDELGIALNKMLDRIALLVSTVRRVSVDIAHDLRTPLTRVRHSLDAAARADTDTGRKSAIDDAGINIDQTLLLFDAMLDLAEIDAGEARARFSDVTLALVVERAVDAYKPEIEASGRTINFSADDACEVKGDPDLLTRAVVNLVDNALKYSRSRARITVRTQQSPTSVSVTVEDDGPGVSEAMVETMFRPFGRLDEARGKDGNGLGLPIVLGVANLHGGRIVVRHLSPGLSMSIELPLGQKT